MLALKGAPYIHSRHHVIPMEGIVRVFSPLFLVASVLLASLASAQIGPEPDGAGMSSSAGRAFIINGSGTPIQTSAWGAVKALYH
jgi:hypothetical protein